MIKSMTGYGGAKGSAEGFEITIELKSVNNRYLDTNVRLPRNFLFAEESVKAAVAGQITRGKVDVFISVDSTTSNDVVVSVNDALAQEYADALRRLAADLGTDADLSANAIARFPDVLIVEKREANKEAIIAGLQKIMEQTLAEFNAMRVKEGERLKEDILTRLDTIEMMVATVEARSPQTVVEYREKLLSKMREVLDMKDIDDNRILMEAAVYADKIAVDEETVRLRSHIVQMRDMLAGDSPVGRKLDFLIQEFNREANTIGSKCGDSQIAKTVVDLKSEIEKIREQIQNIE
jgi:uncharacterized protein (TIGR00255 family)